jgi:hypothetical protein
MSYSARKRELPDAPKSGKVNLSVQQLAEATMIRHISLRDFTMCKAVLLAGLIGVGLLAATLGDAGGASVNGYDEASSGGQIEFIDWDCAEQPVLFAPWI